MAIVYQKVPAEDKFLQAFNNNILRFSSDITATAANASITGAGINVVLYPHPDGKFFFNFKDYISTIINTKNFQPEVNPDFTDPSSTFQIGVDDGLYQLCNFTITIAFAEEDQQNDQSTLALHFVLGAEQMTDQFTKDFDNSKALNILSPRSEDGRHYIKFWRGYPFEFSTLLGLDSELDTEVNTAIEYQEVTFYNQNRINAVYLSDGANYFLETLFPRYYISNSDAIVEQVFDACGIYVRFRNKYGRWNYWLFENGFLEARNTKSLGELTNDIYDVADMISPTIQIGKTSDSTVKVVGTRLVQKYKLILEELIDSPKIYLFVGKPNTVATIKDWVEVKLKSPSFIVHDPKKVSYNYSFEFDLPNRYTATL